MLHYIILYHIILYYIILYYIIFARAKSFNQGNSVETLPQRMLHPVSITRFPLTIFSPGAGLLRNPFVTLSMLRLSRGWVRKDGNLLTETGGSMELLSMSVGRTWRDSWDGEAAKGGMYIYTYTYV